MVYITGDVPGDIRRFGAPARRLKKGDTLIVCGDFGMLWEGGEEEEKLLKKLGEKKYTIAFVDGTHENFDLLEQYPVQEWNGGSVHKLNENVYHLMRGQVFSIEEKTFFTFGGGESTEKQMYQAAGKWWEREMPTLEEMKEGAAHLREAGMKVDYIVTHSPPPHMQANLTGSPDIHNQIQAYFETLSKKITYRKWFFGSLHIDRKLSMKNYSVFQAILPVEQEP